MKREFIPKRVKPFDTIRYFRKNSVFFRFYLLNLLIALLMIIIASVYISNLIDQNNRAKTRQINSQQIESTIDQVDNTIFFINRILQSVANNRYIVDAVIRPNPDYTDRNQNVIAYLRSVKRDNNYISKAYVYEDTQRTLFSSEGSIVHLNADDITTIVPLKIIENMDHDPAAVVLNKDHTFRTVLTVYENEAYLCYQSITATWGGYHSTIIAKLNTNYLFNNVITKNETLNHGITVCVNDTVLYSNLDKRTEIYNQTEQIQASSHVTGWSYRAFPHLYEGTRLIFIIKEILPFLGIAVFFSLTCALIIAQSFYYPISALTSYFWKQGKNSVSQSNDNNEIDFLYRSYSEILRDKERAEYLIRDVQPELERKLFASLIDGVEYEPEQLTLRFNDIQSAFTLNGCYRVLFIRFEIPEKSEYLAAYLAIRDIVYGMIELTMDYPTIQYIQRNQFGILLIQHKTALSKEQTESIEKGIETQVYQILNTKGAVYNSVWGCPFKSLLELHKVCIESNDIIRHQIYISSAQEEEPVAIVKEPCLESSIDIPLCKFQELLDKNKIAEAEHELQILLPLIAKQSEKPSEIYNKLLDVLVEKSIQFHAESFDTENYKKLYHALQTENNSQILESNVEQAALQMLETLKSQALRRQNRFIVKAKEYVEENYANGDLSVQMIADHVGISASYLSNLFTTLTGDSLVSFISHYRVGIAIHLLQSTTISIKEIGFKTGFNTPQNFNRVFKRITGKNPGLFRKEGPVD